MIDRLLHFSTTVNIRGESYRLKNKKRAGAFTMALRDADRVRLAGGEFQTGDR